MAKQNNPKCNHAKKECGCELHAEIIINSRSSEIIIEKCRKLCNSEISEIQKNESSYKAYTKKCKKNADSEYETIINKEDCFKKSEHIFPETCGDSYNYSEVSDEISASGEDKIDVYGVINKELKERIKGVTEDTLNPVTKNSSEVNVQNMEKEENARLNEKSKSRSLDSKNLTKFIKGNDEPKKTPVHKKNNDVNVPSDATDSEKENSVEHDENSYQRRRVRDAINRLNKLSESNNETLNDSRYTRRNIPHKFKLKTESTDNTNDADTNSVSVLEISKKMISDQGDKEIQKGEEVERKSTIDNIDSKLKDKIINKTDEEIPRNISKAPSSDEFVKVLEEKDIMNEGEIQADNSSEITDKEESKILKEGQRNKKNMKKKKYKKEKKEINDEEKANSKVASAQNEEKIIQNTVSDEFTKKSKAAELENATNNLEETSKAIKKDSEIDSDIPPRNMVKSLIQFMEKKHRELSEDRNRTRDDSNERRRRNITDPSGDKVSKQLNQSSQSAKSMIPNEEIFKNKDNFLKSAENNSEDFFSKVDSGPYCVDETKVASSLRKIENEDESDEMTLEEDTEYMITTETASVKEFDNQLLLDSSRKGSDASSSKYEMNSMSEEKPSTPDMKITISKNSSTHLNIDEDNNFEKFKGTDNKNSVESENVSPTSTKNSKIEKQDSNMKIEESLMDFKETSQTQVVDKNNAFDETVNERQNNESQTLVHLPNESKGLKSNDYVEYIIEIIKDPLNLDTNKRFEHEVHVEKRSDAAHDAELEKSLEQLRDTDIIDEHFSLEEVSMDNEENVIEENDKDNKSPKLMDLSQEDHLENQLYEKKSNVELDETNMELDDSEIVENVDYLDSEQKEDTKSSEVERDILINKVEYAENKISVEHLKKVNQQDKNNTDFEEENIIQNVSNYNRSENIALHKDDASLSNSTNKRSFKAVDIERNIEHVSDNIFIKEKYMYERFDVKSSNIDRNDTNMVDTTVESRMIPVIDEYFGNTEGNINKHEKNVLFHEQENNKKEITTKEAEKNAMKKMINKDAKVLNEKQTEDIASNQVENDKSETFQSTEKISEPVHQEDDEKSRTKRDIAEDVYSNSSDEKSHDEGSHDQSISQGGLIDKHHKHQTLEKSSLENEIISELNEPKDLTENTHINNKDKEENARSLVHDESDGIQETEDHIKDESDVDRVSQKSYIQCDSETNESRSENEDTTSSNKDDKGTLKNIERTVDLQNIMKDVEKHVLQSDELCNEKEMNIEEKNTNLKLSSPNINAEENSFNDIKGNTISANNADFNKEREEHEYETMKNIDIVQTGDFSGVEEKKSKNNVSNEDGLVEQMNREELEINGRRSTENEEPTLNDKSLDENVVEFPNSKAILQEKGQNNMKDNICSTSVLSNNLEDDNETEKNDDYENRKEESPNEFQDRKYQLDEDIQELRKPKISHNENTVDTLNLVKEHERELLHGTKSAKSNEKLQNNVEEKKMMVKKERSEEKNPSDEKFYEEIVIIEKGIDNKTTEAHDHGIIVMVDEKKSVDPDNSKSPLELSDDKVDIEVIDPSDKVKPNKKQPNKSEEELEHRTIEKDELNTKHDEGREIEGKKDIVQVVENVIVMDKIVKVIDEKDNNEPVHENELISIKLQDSEDQEDKHRFIKETCHHNENSGDNLNDEMEKINVVVEEKLAPKMLSEESTLTSSSSQLKDNKSTNQIENNKSSEIKPYLLEEIVINVVENIHKKKNNEPQYEEHDLSKNDSAEHQSVEIENVNFVTKKNNNNSFEQNNCTILESKNNICDQKVLFSDQYVELQRSKQDKEEEGYIRKEESSDLEDVKDPTINLTTELEDESEFVEVGDKNDQTKDLKTESMTDNKFKKEDKFPKNGVETIDELNAEAEHNSEKEEVTEPICIKSNVDDLKLKEVNEFLRLEKIFTSENLEGSKTLEELNNVEDITYPINDENRNSNPSPECDEKSLNNIDNNLREKRSTSMETINKSSDAEITTSDFEKSTEDNDQSKVKTVDRPLDESVNRSAVGVTDESIQRSTVEILNKSQLETIDKSEIKVDDSSIENVEKSQANTEYVIHEFTVENDDKAQSHTVDTSKVETIKESEDESIDQSHSETLIKSKVNDFTIGSDEKHRTASVEENTVIAVDESKVENIDKSQTETVNESKVHVDEPSMDISDESPTETLEKSKGIVYKSLVETNDTYQIENVDKASIETNKYETDNVDKSEMNFDECSIDIGDKSKANTTEKFKINIDETSIESVEISQDDIDITSKSFVVDDSKVETSEKSITEHEFVDQSKFENNNNAQVEVVDESQQGKAKVHTVEIPMLKTVEKCSIDTIDKVEVDTVQYSKAQDVDKSKLECNDQSVQIERKWDSHREELTLDISKDFDPEINHKIEVVSEHQDEECPNICVEIKISYSTTEEKGSLDQKFSLKGTDVETSDLELSSVQNESKIRGDVTNKISSAQYPKDIQCLKKSSYTFVEENFDSDKKEFNERNLKKQTNFKNDSNLLRNDDSKINQFIRKVETFDAFEEPNPDISLGSRKMKQHTIREIKSYEFNEIIDNMEDIKENRDRSNIHRTIRKRPGRRKYNSKYVRNSKESSDESKQTDSDSSLIEHEFIISEPPAKENKDGSIWGIQGLPITQIPLKPGKRCIFPKSRQFNALDICGKFFVDDKMNNEDYDRNFKNYLDLNIKNKNKPIQKIKNKTKSCFNKTSPTEVEPKKCADCSYVEDTRPLFITTVKSGKFLEPPPEIAAMLGLTPKESMADNQKQLVYSFSSKPRLCQHRRDCVKGDNKQANESGRKDYKSHYERKSSRTSSTMPAQYNPQNPDIIGMEAQGFRFAEAKRRTMTRSRLQAQQYRNLRNRIDSPPPFSGRKHEIVQTLQTGDILEEITDHPPTRSLSIQTDPSFDSIPSTLTARKTGNFSDCQVQTDEIFDYTYDVQPVLDVIMSSAYRDALLEVLQEDELMSAERKERTYKEARNQEQFDRS